MDFTPVDLVSPSGRPWTARTTIELNNLLGKGYKHVEEEPEPEHGNHAQGGWLEPGARDAVNLTPHPEPVLLPPDNITGDLSAAD